MVNHIDWIQAPVITPDSTELVRNTLKVSHTAARRIQCCPQWHWEKTTGTSTCGPLLVSALCASSLAVVKRVTRSTNNLEGVPRLTAWLNLSVVLGTTDPCIWVQRTPDFPIFVSTSTTVLSAYFFKNKTSKGTDAKSYLILAKAYLSTNIWMNWRGKKSFMLFIKTHTSNKILPSMFLYINTYIIFISYTLNIINNSIIQNFKN